VKPGGGGPLGHTHGRQVMDPDATLKLWREAREAENWEEAFEHAGNLSRWLRSGGFEPEGLTYSEREYLPVPGL
jgi:hypothetical protein